MFHTTSRSRRVRSVREASMSSIPTLVRQESLAQQGYDTIRREVRYGRNSRVDFLLESANRPPCYVEIKNVHLMRTPGLAEFPDARTERGRKHLDELGDMVEAGHRAVMLYLVQIGSATRFALARDIDPKYGAAFDRARSRGVEAMAWKCMITRDGIEIATPVPIVE